MWASVAPAHRPMNALRLVFAGMTAVALMLGQTVHDWPIRPAADPPAPAHPLAWDALKKNQVAQPGDTVAHFEFNVTNTAEHTVTITEITASCGCTTADTPPLPWMVIPGGRGLMKVSVDLAEKFGEITKTIHIASSDGPQELQVQVNVPLPQPPIEERKRVERVMLADRQAIFRRDDCVVCHAQPAAFKQGEALYKAACAICHEAEHRASMVPDLAGFRESHDIAWWRNSVAEGRERTLMPAFAQERGGPLNREQIDSLVSYLVAAFPKKTISAGVKPSAQ